MHCLAADRQVRVGLRRGRADEKNVEVRALERPDNVDLTMDR